MPYSMWHDAPHESAKNFLSQRNDARWRDRDSDLAIAGTDSRTAARLEVSPGVRMVGYDNETGKGDDKHLGKRELPYRFVDVDTLVADIDRERRVATPYRSLPLGESRRGGTDKVTATFIIQSGSGTMSVIRM